MRLIDKIRATRKLEAPWFVTPRQEKDWERMANNVFPLLQEKDLTIILIDNVADYYYQSDQEYWDLQKDFPNLAPPFEQFWAEHRLPTRIHSEIGDSDIAHLGINGGKVGVLVTAIHPADIKIGSTSDPPPPNTKWILWCELFIDYGAVKPDTQGPHGSTFLCIDADGALIERPWMQTFCPDFLRDKMRGYITWFYPALLTMCFLHCKNVVTRTEEMPKPLAKKFRAKYPGNQPARYKTLVIEPLKEILRKEGGASASGAGLQKALHICRGHFKDYRQGPGLFGKHHQIVWQPQLVRGGRKSDSPAAKPPAREIEVKL